MYKGKKIIVCSPVGRKESMVCLFKQILKNKHVIDEHHLWVNTIVKEDLEYINEYASDNPDFVILKYGCDELDPKQMGRAHNVKRFYNYCVKPDTLYYKVDDDIIFIENETFEKLAQYKLDNPETFLLYPTIINNSWCTHFLRKYDAIDVPKCVVCDETWYPDFEKAREEMKSCAGTMSDNLDEPKPRDYIPENRISSPLYWSDPKFAYEILNNTYEFIVENRLSDLDIPNIVLDYEPVSINFIMWSGEDFAKFNGNVRSVDDEPWLSSFYPLKYDLKNAIVGNTRVVHYAYWPQRDYLNKTDILSKYETLCMNIPFNKPFFNSFLVKKENGILVFHDFGGYETRNESHIHNIKLSDQKYNFKDFDWILVNTDDRDHCTEYQGVKVLSVSSSSNNFDHVCPDFLFDKWPEVAINDYEEVCNQISLYGDEPPETNALGWRGNTNSVRSILVSQSDGDTIDAQWIQWVKKETVENDQNLLKIDSPTNFVSNNYISIPEHSKRWRYLIDIEGAGHSGRINFFMFSKRVVFVVDRPWKQWFFEYMIPWEHYVPVSRDMSDLKENLNRVKKNPKLEQKIINNSYKFAQKHLTRKAALSRWNQLLN